MDVTNQQAAGVLAELGIDDWLRPGRRVWTVREHYPPPGEPCGVCGQRSRTDWFFRPFSFVVRHIDIELSWQNDAKESTASVYVRGGNIDEHADWPNIYPTEAAAEQAAERANRARREGQGVDA